MLDFHKKHEFYNNNGFDLNAHWLFLAENGSVSQNLNTPESNHDFIGVVIPPMDYSLAPFHDEYQMPFKHWEWKDEDGYSEGKFYSLLRFAELVLNGNPSVVSVLWNMPYHMQTHPHFNGFINKRHALVSYDTVRHCMGFAKNEVLQMQRVTKESSAKRVQYVSRFGYYPKSAVAAIRMLKMSIELCNTGELTVYRTGDREQLMEIKRGEWQLSSVLQYYEELNAELLDVGVGKVLREHVDKDVVRALVLDIYRRKYKCL